MKGRSEFKNSYDHSNHEKKDFIAENNLLHQSSLLTRDMVNITTTTEEKNIV